MPSKIDKEIKDTSFENLNTELLELEKKLDIIQRVATHPLLEKNTTKIKINPGPQRRGGMTTVHGLLNRNITILGVTK